MGLSVFISYATADAGFYRISEVAENLTINEDIDIVYFWQEHAVENIFDYMRNNIPKSDVFLIFFSKNTIKSDPVQKELNAALYSQRVIIPIFVEDKFIDLLLSGERGVKYDESDFEGFIKEINSLIWKKFQLKGDRFKSIEEVKKPMPPPIQPKVIIDELRNIFAETEKEICNQEEFKLSEKTTNDFQTHIFDVIEKHSIIKSTGEDKPYLIVTREEYEKAKTKQKDKNNIVKPILAPEEDQIEIEESKEVHKRSQDISPSSSSLRDEILKELERLYKDNEESSYNINAKETSEQISEKELSKSSKPAFPKPPISLRGSIVSEIKSGLKNRSILLIRLTKKEIDEIESEKKKILEKVVYDLEKKKQKKLKFDELIELSESSIKKKNFSDASEALLDAYLLAKFLNVEYNPIEKLAFIFGAHEHYSINLKRVNSLVENNQFNDAISEGELLRNFCIGRGWEERKQKIENLMIVISQKRLDNLERVRPEKLKKYELLQKIIKINIDSGEWANARQNLSKARKVAKKYDINSDILDSLAKVLILKMESLRKRNKPYEEEINHQEITQLIGGTSLKSTSILEFSGKYLMNRGKPLIVDNGSLFSKIGFAGNAYPNIILPTIIGYPINSWILDEIKDSNIECYIGHEALKLKNEVKSTYPIEYGWIRNWEDMEKIWNYIFNNILKIDPFFYPVAFIVPSLFSNADKEKLAEIMFENFNIPGLYILDQAKLICFSVGTMNGLVVELGEGVTQIVPVINGSVLTHAINKMFLGGRNLTAYLQRLIKNRGYYFQTSAEFEILRAIREKLCYFALDPTKELSKYNYLSNLPYEEATKNQKIGTYKISKDREIFLRQERFLVPEVYFNPYSIGSETEPLYDCIINSVSECKKEVRRDLYQNIILSGGITNTPGLKERLLREIKDRVNTDEINPQIFVHPKPNYSAWLGGSILTSMNSFKDLWITKEEYKEYGSQIVQRCV